MTPHIRAALIGTGGMAAYHIRQMLQQQQTTQIVALCDPSEASLTRADAVFTEAGLDAPPHFDDYQTMLRDCAGGIDAVLISTPHAMHHEQTKACLEAGIDVLLEKPMVLNVPEALSLIETRDQTGRLLVVAFQGSLSPQIRTASAMLRAGDFGSILNISGVVWQNWEGLTVDTWRQSPALSGGGFLFDTGAHMLNTLADLAGEEFDEVAAWMDNRGRPVDILSVVMGRLRSGALVTINACGSSIPACASDIRVFCQEAIVRTGMWGERLELQRAGESDFQPVEVPSSLGVWEQFLAVRSGEIENPSPPEIGLRMTRLWDAIKASAAQNGAPVKC